MNVLDMASLQRTWLGRKQAVIADNIANANTPGYSAKAIQEFNDLLRTRQTDLQTTNVRHIPSIDDGVKPLSEEAAGTISTHSGNTVDVDSQMLDAGELRSTYALNVSISKTFGRMLLATTRG